MKRLLNIILILPLTIWMCTPKEDTAKSPEISTEIIPFSPGPNAQIPNLMMHKDVLYMSWVEKGDSSQLFFSTYKENTWTPPNLVTQGKEWFVNWADFPAMVGFGNNLAIHNLEKSDEATFAYDVILRISEDAGQTWGKPFKLHNDTTQTEHGFVSMVPLSDSTFFSTWLDGRNTASSEHGEHKGAMTLRGGIVHQNQKVDEFLLDNRICDCCQTTAIKTEQGLFVAYRNRSEEEVRDIYYTTWDGEKWTEEKPIHDDQWKIAGCPVNGPSADASGNRLGIAWFTGANDTSRVNLKISSDGGKSFGQVIRVDEGKPLGRVDLILVNDGKVFVTWLESKGENEAEIRGKLYSPEGQLLQTSALATTSASRASGFPRIIKYGDQIILANT
ncbi:MAG: glycoside hydrolase, partial [Cyclobacteriaceae bacterium]|nr:glycoside hydrolase [Cyclobacteriaceae bacterium]